MPSFYEIIASLIAGCSLFISFLSFRDRRTKEQTEAVTIQLREISEKLHAHITEDAAVQATIATKLNDLVDEVRYDR